MEEALVLLCMTLLLAYVLFSLKDLDDSMFLGEL